MAALVGLSEMRHDVGTKKIETISKTKKSLQNEDSFLFISAFSILKFTAANECKFMQEWETN